MHFTHEPVKVMISAGVCGRVCIATLELTGFQFSLRFINVDHSFHLNHGRKEASEAASCSSSVVSRVHYAGVELRQTRGWSVSLPHDLVYLCIRRTRIYTLQRNSMSKSNKHEQRTSAKHQQPNPLRWETVTVDAEAYGLSNKAK